MATHAGNSLIQSTVSKNYLKWQEAWQLDSCTVNGLEGTKLCENLVVVISAIGTLNF